MDIIQKLDHGIVLNVDQIWDKTIPDNYAEKLFVIIQYMIHKRTKKSFLKKKIITKKRKQSRKIRSRKYKGG